VLAESSSGLGRLTVSDAQRLTRQLVTQESPTTQLRIGVIHTFTSDLLDPWFALHGAVQGFKLETYHAPYGLNIAEAHADSPLARFSPDLTLILLQRCDLHPDLKVPHGSARAELRRLNRAARDRVCGIVQQFRRSLPGRIVVAILPEPRRADLGLYDVHATHSEASWWASFKHGLANAFSRSVTGATLLDLDEVLYEFGRSGFFDFRFWNTARFPFTASAASEVCRRVVAIGVIDRLPKAKAIVLDADNTLWGGIIGEDGMSGIQLGPEYPGSVFMDFQRRLLGFQSRGFILALCSKNNPEDVAEVLEEHPHQLLRQRHFAASRVNWAFKHDNIQAIAAELNIGLDSIVFVDDSEQECALVRKELPEVTVIQTPKKPIEIPDCLDYLARLEVTGLTEEDLAKTQLYASERQRKELKSKVESSGRGIQDYLESLKMRMAIFIDDRRHLTRLAQLTSKTNQFNLTTRRYDEEQISRFIESDDWLVASFSLADIFGDSGIVGLALVKRLSSDAAEIDSFLMSCRVIGRKAESAFLEAVLGQLASDQIREVFARFIPTAKNGLVEQFYDEHGFSQAGDPGTYLRNLGNWPPRAADTFPIEIDYPYRGDR
jgi:FkbH-like protein